MPFGTTVAISVVGRTWRCRPPATVSSGTDSGGSVQLGSADRIGGPGGARGVLPGGTSATGRSEFDRFTQGGVSGFSAVVRNPGETLRCIPGRAVYPLIGLFSVVQFPKPRAALAGRPQRRPCVEGALGTQASLPGQRRSDAAESRLPARKWPSCLRRDARPQRSAIVRSRVGRVNLASAPFEQYRGLCATGVTRSGYRPARRASGATGFEGLRPAATDGAAHSRNSVVSASFTRPVRTKSSRRIVR